MSAAILRCETARLRLGVMVDVSHVSDKTFYDTLEVTRAPVIASHSSCRAISNSPRNMTDDMLRALAKNGGVIMILGGNLLRVMEQAGLERGR